MLVRVQVSVEVVVPWQSPSNEFIEKQLSSRDERMIALTDAGTPFRDKELNDSNFNNH